MAYMNQQKKSQIAAKLKPILKKYGLKGSLSVRNHSTICLTVKAGEIDFISNYNDCLKNKHYDHQRFAKDSLDVNVYWYKEHFGGRALECLQEIMGAMYSAGWYDRSDIQTDYFDTAYYVDVQIGRWNKPYQVI